MAIYNLAIDFGNTNVCVYICKKGEKPQVLKTTFGERLLPNYVAYTSKQILVGRSAQLQQNQNSLATFFNFKKLIGTKYNTSLQTPYSFKLIPDKKNEIKLTAVHKSNVVHLSIVDLFVQVFKEIKSIISKTVPEKGKIFNNITITVPINFNSKQRELVLESIKQVFVAKTTNFFILNEPAAAALSYNLNVEQSPILVVDIGGSTTDLCIIDKNQNEYKVLTSEGLTLGGLDIDNLIYEQVSKYYKKEFGFPINKKKEYHIRLQCENAKKSLSGGLDETYIELMEEDDDSDESDNDDDEQVLNFELTKIDFDLLLEPIVNKIIKSIEKMLQEADLLSSQIKSLLYVGGSCRIPYIQERLMRRFPQEYTNHLRDLDFEESVALGACMYSNDQVIKQRLNIPIGIQLSNNTYHILIEKNTNLPVTETLEISPKRPGQTRVAIKILQGSNTKKADKNKLLSEIRLDKINPNQPILFLTLSVDKDMILNVKVVDDKGEETCDFKKII